MKTFENKLYSYKMRHDTRFAPNPLFGVLTLATCKPSMRRNMQIGNWIAGWTSKTLKNFPTNIGEERLIYLARVTKKLTYPEYWEQYPEKRPGNWDDPHVDSYHGDNIYEPAPNCIPAPLNPNTFILHENSHHKTPEKKVKDLKGGYVLICEEFYYFSCLTPLEIPTVIRPNIPKVQTSYGVITEDASEFINYVQQHAKQCKYTDAK
jgi:hypothetical protein